MIFSFIVSLLPSLPFCLLLIFVAILVFLLHRILRPIHVLCGAIQTAESGNLAVRVPLARQDEFGMIGNQFNVLLESIEQLIHENYETRVLKNEFELKYIQNQLKEDQIEDQMTIKEYIDPFTGSKE